MLTILLQIEKTLCLLITLCYAYQIVYLVVMVLSRPDKPETARPQPLHHYGIVIAARNEAAVIGHLLDSIRAQDYPQDQLSVYVMADNCSDNTADIARAGGATVYTRSDNRRVGKGYALQALFTQILAIDRSCEAFIVVDADNLLARDYVRAMNRTYNEGFRVITSYRNSKNFAANWLSAGYGLWFLREARYLNHARLRLGTSCTISGTGFLLRRDVLEEDGGWPYLLLTEDIEFSVDHVIRGERIGYCPEAILYDEQPTKFGQSWRQRLRWARGFYQVLLRYGGRLARVAVTRPSFAAFDLFMSILPARFVTVFAFLLYCIKLIDLVVTAPSSALLLQTLLPTLYSAFYFYSMIYAVGLLTTISEWPRIACSSLDKIRYTFTFPFFMLTYIPISVAALFGRVRWLPIRHTVACSLEDVCRQNRKTRAAHKSKVTVSEQTLL